MHKRDLRKVTKITGAFGWKLWDLDFGFSNKTRNTKTDFDALKSLSKMDFKSVAHKF